MPRLNISLPDVGVVMVRWLAGAPSAAALSEFDGLIVVPAMPSQIDDVIFALANTGSQIFDSTCTGFQLRNCSR